LDEAERSYTEAEKKMHEATQGQATLKREVESLQQALIGLSQQQAAARVQTAEPDLAAQLETKLAEQIAQLDFETDPDAAKKLSKLIVTTTNQVAEAQFSTRTAKQSQDDAMHGALKAKLKPIGLEEYYDDFFGPALDRLTERDKVFLALPSEMKFERVVGEMRRMIDVVKSRVVAAQAGQAAALEAGGGMGKGGGAIPIKRDQEPDDKDPGSFADDMKAIRQQRTLKMSAF
jgi:hypothetical protein